MSAQFAAAQTPTNAALQARARMLERHKQSGSIGNGYRPWSAWTYQQSARTHTQALNAYGQNCKQLPAATAREHLTAIQQNVAATRKEIAKLGDEAAKEAEVQEKDADGYPKVARIVMDATVLKDTMVMSYQWPKDRQSVSWTLVSSSLLRALEGSYRLAPKGSGTEVTYELSVDLAMPMIGLLKRKAERRLTDTALKDLKKRVEAE